MPASIDTGVDKLIRIVNEHEKIELCDAAKILGVPSELVQEWANFLGEEHLIDIKYSLTKTYLCKRIISKDEIVQKTKDYQGKKEAFIRKVDTSLQQLDKKTSGFEVIKNTFAELEDLPEMSNIREDVELLKHFEDIKKVVDEDIAQQQKEYGSAVQEFNSTLQKEQQRYDAILTDIESEIRRLKTERSDVENLATDEEKLTKQLQSFEDTIQTIRERLAVEKNDIKKDEDRLVKLRNLAEHLHEDLTAQKEKDFAPLKRISEDQSERIKRLQQEIINKVKDQINHQHHLEGHADEVAQQLKNFFTQREHLTALIKEIDANEQELKNDLGALMLKAKAFDMTSQKGEINQHIVELNKKFEEYGAQKDTLNAKLNELHKEFDNIAGIKPNTSTTSEKTVK